MEIKMKKVAVLSCWFGYKFNKPLKINSFITLKQWIYVTIKNRLPYWLLDAMGFISIIPQAPKGGERCYFYSNNKRLKNEVEFKGWVVSVVQYKFIWLIPEMCLAEAVTK